MELVVIFILSKETMVIFISTQNVGYDPLVVGDSDVIISKLLLTSKVELMI